MVADSVIEHGLDKRLRKILADTNTNLELHSVVNALFQKCDDDEVAMVKLQDGVQLFATPAPEDCAATHWIGLIAPSGVMVHQTIDREISMLQ